MECGRWQMRLSTQHGFVTKRKGQRNFRKVCPFTVSVLNHHLEIQKFNLSDLRIPKEWVDGVWKMEKEIEVQQTQSVKPRQDDHAKKHVVGMKRKATAQPVDHLAFLQREKKRPIVPRNPPMHVTPEYMPLYINGNKIEKDFFEYLDYAENNLKEKHVDAAYAMLNQKRIEQSSWFSEQGIPKACFVPVQFLETVGYCYENLQKPDKKGINILKGWVGEVVRGLIRPNKMWMQDVDIVYGVVHERLVDHFIGGGDTSDGEHNHNLSLWRSQG
ncbi:unnamed protein product [Brassica napus]|uniref:(rape) hypothetical protein n=1 Tax=Brassica napus TaxID=3708 RepID=A0A816JNH7_BRANA|nr:unnamed protein product [Brassica napus]